MAKCKLKGLEKSVPFKTKSGEDVTLTIKPLSRVEKVDVIELLTRGAYGEAERLLLRYGVQDWAGFVDEDNNKPAKFSFDALDCVLGQDDKLALDVHNHLIKSNRLGDEEEQEAQPPLGSSTSSESGSCSTAERSPGTPVSLTS